MSRLPQVALGFGVAAVLSAWNPLAAPFGLIVGGAAAALAGRAITRGLGDRWLAWAALATGCGAVLCSLVFLLVGAGAVGAGLASPELSPGRDPAEGQRMLDSAAKRTAPARDRAARELP
jgi:hypothetical protein